MRKIISFVVCVAMIFALTGCFANKPGKGENVPATDSADEKNNDKTSADSDSSKVDIANYVSVKFEGKNTAGRGSVKFNKEKFLLDHIGNISFNQENYQVYKELYGDTDTSAANAILKYVSVQLTKSSGLSNGDKVETVLKINAEKVDTYFVWDYTFSPQSYTVEGLSEAKSFDPFENFKLSFSGIAPYAEISTTNYASNRGGAYSVTPSSNLKNGDTVTVKYTCEDKKTMIARYGEYPASYEKTYTVSGLDTYVQSIDEISDSDFEKLVANARENIRVIGYGIYRDAKYCGNYFYTAKDQPAHGVYFLQWCGHQVGNAVCFVFEHPTDLDKPESSGTTFTVIALENLMFDENGNLVYNKYEMWQMSQKYKSQDAVTEAFVGVFDDIMHCDNNVTFE